MVQLCIPRQFGLVKFRWELSGLVWFGIIWFGMDEFGLVHLTFCLVWKMTIAIFVCTFREDDVDENNK